MPTIDCWQVQYRLASSHGAHGTALQKAALAANLEQMHTASWSAVNLYHSERFPVGGPL